ncbi:non-ribosomal peptide synthetase [Streptomyces capitiformicae]|uniref:Carrier domain-containing protein n=1 Tax=Streptomyces capitiformicae TaxID=2014920 RepID=A0A919DCX7_9ACTN|nr:non-ribosomal peptide synthetase [Streptomyces capitiformicae]GHE34638.1 hypothetical protein GCM10017771_52340 [Streptomyces capitiformicae]
MTSSADDSTVEDRLLSRIRAARTTRTAPAGGLLRQAPLSFAQRSLWLQEQLGAGGVDYVIPAAYRLTGPLDADRLCVALSALVERHHILRTRFGTGPDGEPVQVIASAETFDTAVLDLSDVASATEREARAVAAAEAEAARPFDLTSGRPLRALFVRLGSEDGLLVLCLHHIVADGWTMGVLIRDLCALYEAEGGPLPPPTLQYADFAVRQHATLTGDRAQRELTYWRSRLEGVQALELPIDHPLPPMRTGEGGQVRFTVPGDVARTLRTCAAAHGASLFMVTLAAFKLLLAKWSGQRDIVVGSAVAGRTSSDLEDLAGNFVNMLVLRTKMDDGLTLGGLVNQVKSVTLEAYDHQELPFERLVAELAPERGPAGANPVFQVTYSLQTIGESERWSIPGVTVRAVDIGAPRAKFDLECQLVERDDGSLHGDIVFATELYEPATVRRMARHFLGVLRAMTQNPGLSVDLVDLLDDAERQELIHGFNDTAVGCPHDMTVHQLIEEQAARTPHTVAIVEDGDRLTYQELNAQANQLSRLLAARGVTPGNLVAVCASRSIDTVVTLLAIWKAGAAYVPVDPDYPDDRLTFMLSDAGAVLLTTQEQHRERMARISAVPQLVVDLERQAVAAQDGGDTEPLSRPGDLAYVLYTSGSTGRPKGVQVTHGSLANYLLWCADAYDLAQGTGSLVHSSLSFDLTVTSLFGPLLAGGRIRLLDDGSGVEELAAAVRRGRDLTLVKLTPTHLELLNRLLAPEELVGRVRTLVVGGEALRADTLRAFRAAGTRIINEYGPTETVVGSIAYEVGPDLPDQGSVPIGRPVANTQAYVLDPQGRPVVRGAVGELHLAGAGVARGYAGRPDVTADRFLPCPYGQPGTRMYRTGDLVRLAHDGRLMYQGRIDDQVKLHGYRIELGEIETVLAGHEEVESCAVALRADGTGEPRLLAAYVPVAGRSPAQDSMRAWCRRHLPRHMIPTWFTLVTSLPLSPNGKIDRSSLPASASASVSPGGDHVPPRTPTECAIAATWCEVLGVERVGLEDNFFDLGGHSLQAVRIMNRLRQQGMELRVRDIMRQQTVRLIAAVLDPGSMPPGR